MGVLSSAVVSWKPRPRPLCLGVFIRPTSSCLCSTPPTVDPLLTSQPHSKRATRQLHTDTMLGTLRSLLAALTCVSAVAVVTQQPPVVRLATGEKATIDCNLGNITNNAARWLKQTPGGIPQFVMHFHKIRADKSEAAVYGPGFSAPHVTSTCPSNTDCSLIIDNVEAGDSAVYYCYTWDSTAKEIVLGAGTKVIVTAPSLPPPVLTVYRPSTTSPLSPGPQALLLCLARQMSIGFAEVSWLVDGSPLADGASTGSAVSQQPDKTFQISSYLSRQTSEVGVGRTYTCQVTVGSSTFQKTIRASECIAG